MPVVAMKRRAYIKIISKEKISISTTYDTKEFKVKKDECFLVDLVKLKRMKNNNPEDEKFWCYVEHYQNNLHVGVYNETANPRYVGSVNTDNENHLKEYNFHSVVIEDD
jgi:hypothetical protein